MTAADIIRDRAGAAPIALGLVLGSGLGGLGDRIGGAVRIPYGELPGFPASGVTGHAGALIVGDLGGARVACLAGRAHYYEHGDARAMRGPIEALAALGVGALFLSNAAGSTRPEMGPGSLMVIADHISISGLNPLIGEPGDGRFVDMSEAYDATLRTDLKALDPDLHEGVYAWHSGPSFETPAEVRATAMLGADAVGMSTVPETILARYFGLRVAGVSVITNLAAGLSATALSHAQTKSEADKAAARFERLATRFAARFA
jgi:purine-nucleoside phosphorylase